MSSNTHDEIVFTKAKREAVHVTAGIHGPPGSGKTLSAIRLATGLARVTPGRILIIDTDNKRSNRYADHFEFYSDFVDAPYHPDKLRRYVLAAFASDPAPCCVIFDDISAGWNGFGGLLEMQETLALASNAKNADQLAWRESKKPHNALVQTITKPPCHIIINMHSTEKTDNGRSAGLKPIVDFRLLRFLDVIVPLGIDSQGRPTWTGHNKPGSAKSTMKWPEYLGQRPQQITEEVGESWARWAAQGSTRPEPTEHPLGGAVSALLKQYGQCADHDTYATCEDERRKLWGNITKAMKQALKGAQMDAGTRLPDIGQPPSEDK